MDLTHAKTNQLALSFHLTILYLCEEIINKQIIENNAPFHFNLLHLLLAFL